MDPHARDFQTPTTRVSLDVGEVQPLLATKEVLSYVGNGSFDDGLSGRVLPQLEYDSLADMIHTSEKELS
jgi:hypothetical protein